MAIYHTESHFGLEIVYGEKAELVSEAGREELPVSDERFEEIVGEVEYWMEKTLIGEELSDLEELLQ